jgi:hypothetical protein
MIVPRFTLPIMLVFITTALVLLPINTSVYSITEDDGWVEGDYEGSPEEQ